MNHLASSLRHLLAAAALLALASLPTLAQTPGSGGPTPGTPPPTSVPLDAGASLLLAGGAAYALHRLRKHRAA